MLYKYHSDPRRAHVMKGTCPTCKDVLVLLGSLGLNESLSTNAGIDSLESSGLDIRGPCGGNGS